MSTIYLPNHVGEEYLKRRQRGPDPFPNPQTNREEVVHDLWEVGVMVAGWWFLETDYLKDLLDKYRQTQVEEARQMEADRAEKDRRASVHVQPSKETVQEALKDALAYTKRKRNGIRKLYQGSGVESL